MGLSHQAIDSVGILAVCQNMMPRGHIVVNEAKNGLPVRCSGDKQAKYVSRKYEETHVHVVNIKELLA